MKKSEITKHLLIEAATAEFAAFGFAGARVDRIAKASGCNKQAIYAYFTDKAGLFESVYNEMVVRVISTVHMDANDLPRYAANLVRHYIDNPEVLRLAFWYELERAGHAPIPSATVNATKDKLFAISTAQKAGVITDRISPEHLLGFILSMANSYSRDMYLSSQDASSFLQALTEAVRRLVHP